MSKQKTGIEENNIEIDIEEHLKKWECYDLKTTSMVLELMELLGYKVSNWRITVKTNK